MELHGTFTFLIYTLYQRDPNQKLREFQCAAGVIVVGNALCASVRIVTQSNIAARHVRVSIGVSTALFVDAWTAAWLSRWRLRSLEKQ